MLDHMSQHPAQHVYPHNRGNKNSSWRCQHCERYCHIRPFCFRLHRYPHPYIHSRLNINKGKKTQAKNMWKHREIVACLIAHTSLTVSSREGWNFDSGCSRHITGEKNYLEELKLYSNSYFKVGDEARRRIKDICKLVIPCFPCLDDVLLVEGLNANLISISQLCDQGLNVGFNKSECIVSNKHREVLMKVSRSNDKCYLWVSQTKV